jgi:hypothetical protein
MGRSTINTVNVVADGTGLSSRVGSALLALMAQRLGLVDGLGAALAGTRERCSGHDPGRVLCDLAVMAADGGRCVSDLAVPAGQPALFGDVASVSTARRVLLSIGEAELDLIREARAVARGRAWEAGAAPERVILDFDATPITIHSEKEHATGHYKGGFGFNPLLATCGREVLAGILRPGNAGANNAADHLSVLDLALEQLPRARLMGRSSRAQTPPGQATTLRSGVASAASVFPLDTRSTSGSEWRSSRSQRPHGGPRQARTASHARGVGSRVDRPGQPRRLAVRNAVDLSQGASSPRSPAVLHRS